MIGWYEISGIILATFLGAVIGLEREFSGKAAGLRTNILICLGAAVFTIISRAMVNPANESVSRIAAQIVTGVGFLGAGAIIQDRGGVHGLTTAATIWLVASIGTACGAGFFLLAVITAVITIIVLIGLAKLAEPLDAYRDKRKQEKSETQNN
ncbi:MgtC/SapB family protein [Planctomycetota bacterium]